MCLLISQPKGVTFTDEHITDFYTRNRDGLGAMWSANGKLCYEKILPKSAEECVKFYKPHAGKEVCLHFRMRTHGDIDHTNCHPYEVFGFAEEHNMPMLLMHNGVLHTGNHLDTKKSDTYQYIRVFLHKMLEGNPGLAFTPEFNEVIGKHIGPNRFAIMNHLGQVAIINKSQGVTFNGAWLSNTYAWSADKYLPRPKIQEWNRKDWVMPAPKSPAQKGAKTTVKSGGTATLKKTTLSGGKYTESERKVFNGIPVESSHLDDVLDIRDTLESVYIDNMTSNRQINAMIDEMGVAATYHCVELLHDGLLTKKEWDGISNSRAKMQEFARIPRAFWTEDKTVDRQVELFQ